MHCMVDTHAQLYTAYINSEACCGLKMCTVADVGKNIKTC